MRTQASTARFCLRTWPGDVFLRRRLCNWLRSKEIFDPSSRVNSLPLLDVLVCAAMAGTTTTTTTKCVKEIL